MPAAIPSGNLCMAMASTNNRMRWVVVSALCRSGSRPVSLCRWGITPSSTPMSATPSTTPIITCHHPEVAVALSTAGRINPTMAAASMVPAQKPMKTSFHLCGMRFTASPMTEPTSEASPRPAAVTRTCCQSVMSDIRIHYPMFQRLSRMRTSLLTPRPCSGTCGSAHLTTAQARCRL